MVCPFFTDRHFLASNSSQENPAGERTDIDSSLLEKITANSGDWKKKLVNTHIGDVCKLFMSSGNLYEYAKAILGDEASSGTKQIRFFQYQPSRPGDDFEA